MKLSMIFLLLLIGCKYSPEMPIESVNNTWYVIPSPGKSEKPDFSVRFSQLREINGELKLFLRNETSTIVKDIEIMISVEESKSGVLVRFQRLKLSKLQSKKEHVFSPVLASQKDNEAYFKPDVLHKCSIAVEYTAVDGQRRKISRDNMSFWPYLIGGA